MVTVMGEDDLVPRQRSRLPVMCALALGTLALGLSFLLDSDRFTERAGLIALCITLETSLYSVCLFAEEWLFHFKQRLESNCVIHVYLPCIYLYALFFAVEIVCVNNTLQ